MSEKILSFFSQLKLETLPRGIQVMNPYMNPRTYHLCEQFYHTYYQDNNSRIALIGINPGRFGGGLTGIPFTDPIRLQEVCGIKNELSKKPELSSEFIYRMMEAYGGIKAFYEKFYFTSVCPLGFTQQGKNLNYYDHPALAKRIAPFIQVCLETQLAWGLNREVAYCLGEVKNYRHLSELNDKHHFFKKIIPLAHPRFIMQYKRKQLDQYIGRYVHQLSLPGKAVS